MLGRKPDKNSYQTRNEIIISFELIDYVLRLIVNIIAISQRRLNSISY